MYVFLCICVSSYVGVCLCQCVHLLPEDSDLPCGSVTPHRDCSHLKTSAHTVAFVFGYLYIIHGVLEMLGEGDLGEPGACLGHGLGSFFLTITSKTQYKLISSSD